MILVSPARSAALRTFAVVDLAGQDIDLAGAAQPLLAVAGNVDADGAQGLEQRLVRRHVDRQLGVMQFDLEARLLCRVQLRGRRGEVLDMQASRPAARQLLQRRQQPLGSAGIDQGAVRAGANHGAQVQPSAVLFGVDVQAVAVVALQPVDERHAGARPAGVVDRIVLAEPFQAVGHGDDGGDADAAGDEEIPPGALVQAEMVLRATDAEGAAGGDGRVDVGGASASVLVFEDGDPQARGVGAVAAQRVLAQVAADGHIDMRPRRPARQATAARVLQRQPHDPVRLLAHVGNAHLAGERLVRRRPDPERGVPVQDAGVAALRVAARVPPHPQVVRAAEGGVRQVGEDLAGN